MAMTMNRARGITLYQVLQEARRSHGEALRARSTRAPDVVGNLGWIDGYERGWKDAVTLIFEYWQRQKAGRRVLR